MDENSSYKSAQKIRKGINFKFYLNAYLILNELSDFFFTTCVMWGKKNESFALVFLSVAHLSNNSFVIIFRKRQLRVVADIVVTCYETRFLFSKESLTTVNIHL